MAISTAPDNLKGGSIAAIAVCDCVTSLDDLTVTWHDTS